MKERRLVQRHKSLLRGRIYFNNRNSTAECLVRDISTHGARLLFEDEVTIPDIVELYMPQKRRTYRVHIIWRHDTEVGIAFAIPEEEEEEEAHAAEAGDLAARITKLEYEIEWLKRAIKRLKSESTARGDFEAA